jgi:hypothetical protein
MTHRNKDRLYITLHARGGKSKMENREDTQVSHIIPLSIPFLPSFTHTHTHTYTQKLARNRNNEEEEAKEEEKFTGSKKKKRGKKKQ